MSSKPYFKLYFSDLAGDTLGLSDAEMGSYLLLLGAMWNAGGGLPKDERELARIARVSPAKWPARWARLKRFFIVERGRVTHNRLTAERNRVAEISQTNSENGKAGAEAKHRKTRDSGLANATKNAKRNRGQTRVQNPKDSPRPPQGGALEMKEWLGSADILDILTAARDRGWALRVLADCREQHLPERALVVTRPWAMEAIKGTQAIYDLRDRGIRLLEVAA